MATCEEELARARLYLDDLNGYLVAVDAEFWRVYDLYIRISGERQRGSGTGSKTIGGAETISVDASASVDGGGGAGTTTQEARGQSAPSPITVLQRRASMLSERLARLEAKV